MLYTSSCIERYTIQHVMMYTWHNSILFRVILFSPQNDGQEKQEEAALLKLMTV